MKNRSPTGARTVAGIADAEDGAVILDGPDGIACTMTHEAAAGTGESLIAAAAKARAQCGERDTR